MEKFSGLISECIIFNDFYNKLTKLDNSKEKGDMFEILIMFVFALHPFYSRKTIRIYFHIHSLK